MNREQDHVLVVAEAGVNHNGDTNLAHKLIDVAAEAGADIVKFQTFHAESVMRPKLPISRRQQKRTSRSLIWCENLSFQRKILSR